MIPKQPPHTPKSLRCWQHCANGYPVYLISGRSVASLSQLLQVPGLNVVGVHGMEAGRLGGDAEPSLTRATWTRWTRCREGLPDIPELNAEDKGLAIALHYRNVDAEGEDAPPKRGLRRCRTRSTGSGVKRCSSCAPTGTARAAPLRGLAAEHPQATPVFIGDDHHRRGGVCSPSTRSYGQGWRGETQAQARLPDVAAVVAYLKRYL